MTTQYIIGIDGGGTHTRAALADLTGRVISESTAGPSNPHHLNDEQLRINLEQAIKETLKQAQCDYSNIACIFLGIAGAGTQKEIDRITKAVNQFIPSHIKVVVNHDLRIALAAGLNQESGIVIVAGTGSACYGRNASGEEYRTSNKDIGSGSWIGYQALIEVQKINGDSQLKKAIHDTIEKASLNINELERHQVASLYPIIEGCAKAENKAANNIIQKGTDSISRLVFEAQSHLKLDKLKLVFSGGLLASTFYSNQLKTKLKTRLPKIHFIETPPPPVTGAIHEALTEIGMEKTSPSSLQKKA